MAPFAGWDMPIHYQSILKEHLAVRSEVGIFDISHMGVFFFTGKDNLAFLNHLISNDLKKIDIGKGLYSGMLYKKGTFVDDVIVYRLRNGAIFNDRQCRQYRKKPPMDYRQKSKKKIGE